MGKFWLEIQAYSRCLLKVAKLGKLAGGAEALERRLAALEQALASYPLKNRCAHCGSSDLAPTETAPSPAGTQVVKFRCKACGHETSITSGGMP